jgi:hypothetical protein
MVESIRKDPITKTILPPKDLFLGAGGNGLCSQYFTGATCPTGQVVIGSANGIPVCSVANIGVPAGAVMAFGLAACPPGWETYAPAAGRVIAGTGGAGVGVYSGAAYTLGAQSGDSRLSVQHLPTHSHEVWFDDLYRLEFDYILPYTATIGGPCSMSGGTRCLLAANGDGVGPFAKANANIRDPLGNLVNGAPQGAPIAPPAIALNYCYKL